MKIVLADSRYLPAVRDFNLRIRSANTTFSLPESIPVSPSFAGPRNTIRIEDWLAVDEGVVRGGYRAIKLRMLVAGTEEEVAFLQQPVSEGLVDPKHNLTGFALVRHFQAMYPLSYGLGMGGTTRPLPRMMSRLNWHVRLVPFFFYVCNASAFLRNTAPLRSTFWRKTGADVLAASGLGAAGLRLVHRWRREDVGFSRVDVEERLQFTPWADEIWDSSARTHSFSSVLDACTLDHLFPSTDSRFHRVEISRARERLGLLLLGDTRMQGNQYFGNMRVGSIIYAAAPVHARPVVARAAIEVLMHRGVDLIITNQQDESWGNSLRKAGCLEAQSNFAMALAPATAARVLAVDPECRQVHLGRANGDGPINI